jgi:hypothetical protein
MSLKVMLISLSYKTPVDFAKARLGQTATSRGISEGTRSIQNNYEGAHINYERPLIVKRFLL